LTLAAFTPAAGPCRERAGVAKYEAGGLAAARLPRMWWPTKGAHSGSRAPRRQARARERIFKEGLAVSIVEAARKIKEIVTVIDNSGFLPSPIDRLNELERQKRESEACLKDGSEDLRISDPSGAPRRSL